ncbi:MAG: hypothetical protein ACJAYG_000903 [Oceanicoccus sp.]|jgi:hypothetical protein
MLADNVRRWLLSFAVALFVDPQAIGDLAVDAVQRHMDN